MLHVLREGAQAIGRPVCGGPRFSVKGHAGTDVVEVRTAVPSVGDKFPDLQLRDHLGHPRALSDLVGGDPALLHFFRGWWCPKERQFFRRLVDLADDAEVAYTRFVSVSVDAPAVQAAFRAGLDARWTFLSDQDRRYLDQLGLAETTDDVHHPYLPTCLVLTPDLMVHKAYGGYWYWGRPTMEELRRDFREVTRTIRPDWDPPS